MKDRPEGYSNLNINGNWLTWEEAALDWSERHSASEQLVTILFDLDRCEHGRHEGDNCNGCGGPSQGNPLVAARQLGFDISGRPILLPKRSENPRDPEAWRTKGGK